MSKVNIRVKPHIRLNHGLWCVDFSMNVALDDCLYDKRLHLASSFANKLNKELTNDQ